jgi:non-heme chloroperoxidase
MMADLPASCFHIIACSETDGMEDLERFGVPTLVVHRDADEIVPVTNSTIISSKLIKAATLEVIEGSSHVICTTLKDRINAGLLVFIAG